MYTTANLYMYGIYKTPPENNLKFTQILMDNEEGFVVFATKQLKKIEFEAFHFKWSNKFFGSSFCDFYTE